MPIATVAQSAEAIVGASRHALSFAPIEIEDCFDPHSVNRALARAVARLDELSRITTEHRRSMMIDATVAAVVGIAIFYSLSTNSPLDLFVSGLGVALVAVCIYDFVLSWYRISFLEGVRKATMDFGESALRLELELARRGRFEEMRLSA